MLIVLSFVLFLITLIYLPTFIIIRVVRLIKGSYNYKRLSIDILTFVILVIIFFSSRFYTGGVFSAAFDNHYDIKKNTWDWHFTMTNKTINNFPIINIADKVEYNHIGGDSPSIAGGWNIYYSSRTDYESLFDSLNSYLNTEGYNIQYDSIADCAWHDYKESDNVKIFSGNNDDYCINLIFMVQSDSSIDVRVYIRI